MPPRRPMLDAFSTAGDIEVSAGWDGADAVVRDGRPRGFYAVIGTRGTGNAYAFARADDGSPTGQGAFAALEGAPEQGDGVNLCAYESGNRTDVPVGAVAWLEPLRLSIGYGFVYGGAASSAVTAQTALAGGGYDVTTGAAEDTGLSVTIPSAGTYLIFGRVSGYVVANLTGTGAWYELTAGVVVAGAPADLSTAIVASVNGPAGTTATAFGSAPIFYTAAFAGGEVLKLYAQRSASDSVTTWAAAHLNGSGVVAGALVGGTHLGYLKVG